MYHVPNIQASAQNVDLSKLLTRELLGRLRRIQLPWAETEPLDFSAVGKYYFRGQPDNRKEYYQLTFHEVLKPLSTIGVDNFPDLMQILPPPEDPDFPPLALGMLTLFDQCPRSLFSGVNERYTYSYFDPIAAKFCRQLHALPPSLRPDNIQRLMSLGWSYDYASIARFWFMTPLVHSEKLEDHEHQLALTETFRTHIEEHVGKTDENRETLPADSEDIYLFPELIKAAPVEPGKKIDDFFFWLFRVFVVHTPIIRKFGHYAYRNNGVGRVSTPEEIEYVVKTNYFATLRDEAATKKIREDVEAGIWSPLQDEPQFNQEGAGKVANHLWDTKK